MTEIQDITPDPETVIVTVEELHCIYERTDSGHDMIGLLVTDPLLGSFFVALAVEQAKQIATNVGNMVGNLDSVRAAWLRKNKP